MTLTPYSVDSTQLENSLGCARGGEHDCATACVFDNANPAYPHLGCMVIEGAALDDRLLWSEVLSAVGFMLRRLLKKEYKMHQLVPVRIYAYIYFIALMLTQQGVCCHNRWEESAHTSSTLRHPPRDTEIEHHRPEQAKLRRHQVSPTLDDVHARRTDAL